MTYIVTEPCIGTKDRACVEVCPVECFYEATDHLYIHPEECIDCAACEPVCPVTAIFPEDSVPDQYKSYIERNYKFDYTNAPHALTKAMLGDQDNFATTFTVEGKTITLPPPYGGPAPPPPKAEAAPAPKAEAPPPPKAEAAPPPQVEAAPKAAAPAATAAAAPAPAAPARVVAGDAVSQMVEAAAAAAEAAARAAEAAAAAVRMLQGKADGRTVSGVPSAPAARPQDTPAPKPAEAKSQPEKGTAPPPTPAQPQAAAAKVAGPDASFEQAKEILYALIDFESGARSPNSDELARAEETASALFEEIGKAVGKRDYTLQDVEKKDVALRQKMELGNAIVDRVGRVRLHMEINRQRDRTRKEIPGALVSFGVAGLCAAGGFVYALTYSFPGPGAPTLQDLLTAPFSPEGFMPFLGFNLLAGLFALFGVLALSKVARSYAEGVQLEALIPKEFGAASLRPRRWSWTHRVKIDSARIAKAEGMLKSLAAKKR